jgi:hypothetical protein
MCGKGQFFRTAGGGLAESKQRGKEERDYVRSEMVAWRGRSTGGRRYALGPGRGELPLPATCRRWHLWRRRDVLLSLALLPQAAALPALLSGPLLLG